jgi:uncharacterized protein
MTDREKILRSRWIRPFAHLFSHPSLWHLNQRSVPRALALGLFAAFIIPVGQFALAALLAVVVRANVPLAAATTLVTNPLTYVPIYIAAHRLGSALLGSGQADVIAHDLGSKLLDVSGPTALGLLIFAIVGAASGFIAGTLWWRIKLIRRWNRRPARMPAGGSSDAERP